MQKMLVAALLLVGLSFTSCREKTTETKTIVKEVEVERVDSDDDGGILERTAKEIDKEVNEEINEEIDKIGNDDN